MSQAHHRVAGEHGALEAFKTHPLRGESISCDQITTDCNAHRRRTLLRTAQISHRS